MISRKKSSEALSLARIDAGITLDEMARRIGCSAAQARNLIYRPRLTTEIELEAMLKAIRGEK